MEELSLPDIVAIIKRRGRIFCLVTAILCVISLSFALHWSNYRSTATVEIDQPYISQNVAATNGENLNDTLFSLADQRISQVEQKVTSQESLAQIIAKFNLYSNARKALLASEQADLMRGKIKLGFISSSMSNPAAAQKETAEQLSAIAFTISFDYSDPEIAQQVTSELVTRFIDEDQRQRQMQTQETSEFLATQIKELEATMAEQDKKIADFRAQHGESGASMMMFNQQSAASTSASIENLDSQITSNEGLQGTLRAQMAVVDPYSRVIAEGQVVTTPAIQLKALEAQYATLSAQYGPDHPDVIKARSQIDALKAQMGVHHKDNTAQLKAQIADTKTNLAAAEATYGADNPDVVTLKQNLKKQQAQLAAARSAPSDDSIRKDADNPAYLELSVQLRSAEEQHNSLLAEREAMVKQRDKYQRAIVANPALEQQMAALSRDEENAQLRYRELKEKKMAADMGQKLEEGRKGQRLVVINPPKVPRHTQPARILLLLGGVIISVLGGIASVIISEAMNQSIHGQTRLEAVTGKAPLVIIPHLLTEAEITHAHHLRSYAIGTVIFVVVLAMIVFVFI